MFSRLNSQCADQISCRFKLTCVRNGSGGGGGATAGREDSDIFILYIVLTHFFVQHFKFQYNIYYGLFRKIKINF